MEDEDRGVGASDSLLRRNDNQVCAVRLGDRVFDNAPVNCKTRLWMECVPNPTRVGLDSMQYTKAGQNQEMGGRALVSPGTLPQVVTGRFSHDGGFLMTKYYCRTRVRGWG